MVESVSGRGRVDAARAATAQRIATLAKPQGAKPAASASATNAAFLMTQDGPPVDAAKVAAIRTAIAEGRYPVDPQAIAQKMIDLDLTPLA